MQSSWVCCLEQVQDAFLRVYCGCNSLTKPAQPLQLCGKAFCKLHALEHPLVQSMLGIHPQCLHICMLISFLFMSCHQVIGSPSDGNHMQAKIWTALGYACPSGPATSQMQAEAALTTSLLHCSRGGRASRLAAASGGAASEGVGLRFTSFTMGTAAPAACAAEGWGWLPCGHQLENGCKAWRLDDDDGYRAREELPATPDQHWGSPADCPPSWKLPQVVGAQPRSLAGVQLLLWPQLACEADQSNDVQLLPGTCAWLAAMRSALPAWAPHLGQYCAHPAHGLLATLACACRCKQARVQLNADGPEHMGCISTSCRSQISRVQPSCCCGHGIEHSSSTSVQRSTWS